MRNRRSIWQTAAALAGATLLSAFAAEGNADTADEAQGVIVHEHRTQLVPGFGPLTVHVWQHGTRIQIVALDDRGEMVVLRSGSIGDGASGHSTPMRGVPMARTRTIGADGTAAVEECASTDCAQAIAVRASSLAAQTNFRATAIERPGSTTLRTVVRMCPIDGDDTAAIATNAAWAWAGAYAPCKWRVVPAAALADWPVAERSARVRVGNAVFQMDRAVLKPVHSGRRSTLVNRPGAPLVACAKSPSVATGEAPARPGDKARMTLSSAAGPALTM